MENIQVEKPTFTLKKWHAVAVWSWNINIEKCAICKYYLSEECPECSEDNKCSPMWGNCTHPYHGHCIKNWKKRSELCPLCAKTWVESNEFENPN